MLFGGGPPAPRRKPAQPAQPAPATQPTPATQPAQPAKPVDKSQEVKPLSPAKGDPNKSTNSAVNQSIKTQGGGGSSAPAPKPTPDSTKSNPKDTSILKPEPSGYGGKTGGTIPIISKPQINNYVDEKPKQPAVEPQPQQQEEEVIIEAIHGFGNKNKFNKPGFLRKGKKVAENFKFAEENVTLHSAVDVVRPFEVDRTRQKKLNDFDFHDF